MENSYLIILVFVTLLISLNVYWLREKKILVEKQNTLQSQLNKLTMANDEEYRIEVQSEEEFAAVVDKFEDPLWHIYRNVEWEWRSGGSKNNPKRHGEIDFLLVHKDFGVVMIEVKGGTGITYNAKDNKWWGWKGNKQIQIEGPYEQIQRNYSKLRDKIQFEAANLELKNFRPRINSFVVWTNVSSNESKFGFIGYDENTFYQDDLINPVEVEKRIKNQFVKKETSDEVLIQLFNRVLSNNVKGFSLLSYNGKISEKVEKLSNDIFQAYYDITNPNYKKIKIQGIPGTGKTFLATKLAEHEAEQGKKVLLMCYNVLLGDKLKLLLSDYSEISVLTFEDFLNELGISYDDYVDENLETKLRDLDKSEEINYIKSKLDSLIVEADSHFEFDTLIIDEAQDISEKYWEFFTEIVEAKQAKWVVCYDKNQTIVNTEWSPPQYLDTPQLILNTVIRSTKEIAQQYSKVYNDELEHYGESGLNPSISILETGSWDEANQKLNTILKKIKDENEELFSTTTVLVPHSKDIVNLKSKLLEKCSVESISRFKGLESDTVIVVFPSLDGVEKNYINSNLALAYVGLSRAKSSLFLICDREVQKLCNWKVA